jgi:hypothetical protein
MDSEFCQAGTTDDCNVGTFGTAQADIQGVEGHKYPGDRFIEELIDSQFKPADL